MKRYNEEIFQSQCPVYNCSNRDTISWNHCSDPNNPKLYISDEAIIRCGNCHSASPFFENRYDCGEHNDDKYSVRFRYPTNLRKVFAIIGGLEDDPIYSSDFVDRLCESLRNQFRKKYGYI